MTTVFKQDYAELYDLLYQEKDYSAECDTLEGIFKRFASGPVKTVLDLGCGTGSHTLCLAERGYQVTGADRSSEMLAVLKSKADERKLAVTVATSSAQQLQLSKSFDVCISMFAVLSYQYTNSEVEAFLKSASRHTTPGGLFVFDFWYGPAVLAIRPEQRIKIIEQGGERIIRTAIPTLNSRNHCNTTAYEIIHSRGREILREVKEEHTMRFFFPLEIEYFLEQTGFELVRLGSFPNYEQPLSDATWNAFAIAKRKR